MTVKLLAWEAVSKAAEHQTTPLVDLFSRDASRAKTLTLSVGGISADFSKQRLDSESLDALYALANACDLQGWKDKLFSGALPCY